MRLTFSIVAFVVVLRSALPSGNATEIFTDGFEDGRTCWVWSRTEGGTALCFETPFDVPPPVPFMVARASTVIGRADLILGVDTTGSMGGEIANLKTSIQTILDAFRQRV